MTKRLLLTCATLALAIGGCATKKPAVSGVLNTPGADPAGTEQAAQARPPMKERAPGYLPRHGDEIMVCGKLYRTGAPVVLWTDPGGYDAYRVDRRFAPVNEAGYEATTRAIAEGRANGIGRDETLPPARYNVRPGGPATRQATTQAVDRIARGGWALPELQQVVDQFVLHYDVCGTSAVCFRVLHDQRGLSVHFMLDVDGTIYQTLDLKERAWHATKSNGRSIGIEIANMGSYGVDQTAAPLQEWYKRDETGRTYVNIPERHGGRASQRVPGLYRPARDEMVVGEIHGVRQRQYDLTPEQYESLIKLTAALCDVFPEIECDAPRGPDGQVLTRVLTDAEWRDYQGVLGHFHVQRNKSDPGPALQWEKVIGEARRLLAERRARVASR